jgi:hypothetical protein
MSNLIRHQYNSEKIANILRDNGENYVMRRVIICTFH